MESPETSTTPFLTSGTCHPSDPSLARIGTARGCSAAAVALAWTVRTGKVVAIPESGAVTHVQENAVALSVPLTVDVGIAENWRDAKS